MSDTRDGDLAAEGFVRCTVLPSALARWTWSVELVSEQDRELRVVDETVLRLVDAGVADPDRIAALMGVDESEIVPSSIANLMRAGALHHDAGLRISSGGRSTLERAVLRESTREGARLHFDPYSSSVSFAEGGDSFLSAFEMRGRGLHELPIPPAPTERELRAQQLQIQAAFESSLRARGKTGAVDLLRLIPAGEPVVVFEEVDLEVWHRASEHTWRWRIRRDDGNDSAASAVLHALEEDGADVLPLVPLCDGSTSSELDRRLHDIFEGSSEAASGSRYDALSQAKVVAALVPSYPAGYADLVMLHHLMNLELDVDGCTSVVFGGATSAHRGSDPLRKAVSSGGIRVGSTNEALHHGALRCDDRVFVMRYQVQPIDQRRERGVPTVEVRTPSAEHARLLIAELARTEPRPAR